MLHSDGDWDGDWHKGIITPAERAFNYGDGLFETMRVENKSIRFLSYHWQRLTASAARLAMPMPNDAWLALLEKTAQEYDSAVFKLIYSRGQSTRGYGISPNTTPSLFLHISPYDAHKMASLAHGVTVRYGTWRLDSHPHFGGIKHLNRLEQVMARREWQDDSIFESLLMDVSDRIIEGVMSNVFLVTDGSLCTPSLHQQGVAGVMRRVVMENAPCQEVTVTKDDIENCDEMFLTNALIGIVPVTQMATRVLPIGDTTRQLILLVSSRQNGYKGCHES